MSSFENPARRAFLAQMGREQVVAQVWIRRAASGYELRHLADRDRPAEALSALKPDDLRALAQFAADGAFRPLKAAPNLQTGWVVQVRDDDELVLALDSLYPGALADWFAARSDRPPVTDFREFTARQTGMYRITARLSDAGAAEVTRACCHEQFCLKRRLWTAPGLPPDTAARKSVVPCLEPCALLLEFARSVARMDQDEAGRPGRDRAGAANPGGTPAGAEPGPPVREADFSAPANPRLRFLFRERLAASPIQFTVGGDD